MQEREDVLHDWNEEEKEPDTIIVTATKMAWAAQTILGLTLVLYTFRIPGFNAMEYYTKGAVLAPLLVARVVPLLALILLMLERKSGWILTMFCCVSALLRMYESMWNTVQGLFEGVDGGLIPTVAFLLIFYFRFLHLSCCSRWVCAVILT